MDTTKKSKEINRHRRSFLGTAAVTVAAAQFLLNGSAEAQPSKTKLAGARAIKPGTNTSFASLKQIDAGLLNVGYAEAGPSDGPVVILLHGWPYDIHSFVDVAPLLASEGYRVIVPYVRGCGTTRFLSDTTFRNGQPSVVAVDTIALMDALKITRRSSPASIGAGGRPTRSRRSGRSAARRWSPSAVTCSPPPSLTRRRCRQRLSISGGTNITSPLNAVCSATTNTGTISGS